MPLEQPTYLVMNLLALWLGLMFGLVMLSLVWTVVRLFTGKW